MGEATRLFLTYAVCGLPVLLAPGRRTLVVLTATWMLAALGVIVFWETPEGYGFAEGLFLALMVVAGFVGAATGILARTLVLILRRKAADPAAAILCAGIVYALPPLAFFLVLAK